MHINPNNVYYKVLKKFKLRGIFILLKIQLKKSKKAIYFAFSTKSMGNNFHVGCFIHYEELIVKNQKNHLIYNLNLMRLLYALGIAVASFFVILKPLKKTLDR
ncbi:hypothetical protein ATE84_0224 [Aquimarina sp. MAR_2010_214]|nr:hypothetical protein ATE84_0224 [Aquimarina sp. MAR_2010_214]